MENLLVGMAFVGGFMVVYGCLKLRLCGKR
jgi:hypothetical protein